MTMRMTRGGFTLIELLIVIVIVAILAALAIPVYARARARAYRAAMVSDLGNLQNLEEIYYHNGSYAYKTAGTITYAVSDADLNMHASRGVTIVLGPHPNGWAATAAHAALPGQECYVFWGDAGTVGQATMAGNIACNN
ncbi:MAG: prepilin-type N-terminal cleavage/methylation domain-containing protein [Gemmatimonadota bacterium]|jgi:prepilin-type N-terminal cleavage/methylation domain-containing protein